MPVFNVTIYRTFDLQVEASSRKDLDEALWDLTCSNDIDDWDLPNWDSRIGSEIPPDLATPDHGLWEGEILNIEDYRKHRDR